MFWRELHAVIHYKDKPVPQSWRSGYETKHAFARMLNPDSIFEIGVRAGYSAFAFLNACPRAVYLGIDNNGNSDGGFHGAIEHAREILKPYTASILERDSHYIGATLPWSRCDLAHIDADHTYDGCLADLRLALRLSPSVILVDDYLSIPDVRIACETFHENLQNKYTRFTIEDSHNGIAVFVRIPGTQM